MTYNHTPDTQEVRQHWTDVGFGGDGPSFDNWLSEHERRVAEQAWDEAEAYVHTKLHHKTDPMRSVDNNPYRSQK